MKLTKNRMLGVGGAALLLGVSAAQAGLQFPFDPDGAGPLTTSFFAPPNPSPIQLGGLDWAPGNSVAVYDRPIGPEGPQVGDTLTVYYQAKLQAFQGNFDNDPGTPGVQGGVASTFSNDPGTVLGTVNANPIGAFSENFEWTAIARFKEVVTEGGGNGPIKLAVVSDPTNYLRIFYDGPSLAANGYVGGPTTRANDLAGTGFHDGLLILEASGGSGIGSFDPTGAPTPGPINPAFNLDQFLPIQNQLPWRDVDPITPGDQPYQTITGSGDTKIEATITYFDPSFLAFPPLPANGFKYAVFFDTDQELPFDQVDPAIQFRDDAGFIVGNVAGGTDYFLSLVNGANGITPGGYNAVQFEADADNSFDFVTAVPEPATFALGVMGLMGLALRRRRACQA